MLFGKFYQAIRRVFVRRLSNSATLVNDGDVRQPVLFSGHGVLFVGHGTVFGVENSPCFYSGYSYIEARQPCASIKIGCGVWLNNSIVIISNG